MCINHREIYYCAASNHLSSRTFHSLAMQERQRGKENGENLENNINPRSVSRKFSEKVGWRRFAKWIWENNVGVTHSRSGKAIENVSAKVHTFSFEEPWLVWKEGETRTTTMGEKATQQGGMAEIRNHANGIITLRKLTCVVEAIENKST